MGASNTSRNNIEIARGQILKTVLQPNLQNPNREVFTFYQIVMGIGLRGPHKAFDGRNLVPVTQINLAYVARQSSENGIFIYDEDAKTYDKFPASFYRSGKAVIPIEENWIALNNSKNLVIGTKKRFTISPTGAPTEIQAELIRRL
ncbi:hypothetical protein KBC75_06000 [Candidatus Shapirobacteria bacterium]|nr:hypothetical protein [Candidatus Shapirobacteria bacterium]